ncbi:uncharacterized protein LACBIDRAFT_312405 [Laccaria bicolor S238N-H82]|uniref:Predicted protein n=1 Tax=Laccaria bicolor (strain S238N-H82 / ATCC MYA-4686) TaxID=486041 RepID=B0DW32_LACBS|nr:uncharacterized protein LACBIDRAFT_312405 [Laccaria bicolor S238N-H82]EDR01108.1 predicted protein [Laccaria bicolor S238N-H82]|eukprot:XP_001888150.1 predicted protein [Laccaria bicolor S238N-H82]
MMMTPTTIAKGPLKSMSPPTSGLGSTTTLTTVIKGPLTTLTTTPGPLTALTATPSTSTATPSASTATPSASTATPSTSTATPSPPTVTLVTATPAIVKGLSEPATDASTLPPPIIPPLTASETTTPANIMRRPSNTTQGTVEGPSDSRQKTISDALQKSVQENESQNTCKEIRHTF